MDANQKSSCHSRLPVRRSAIHTHKRHGFPSGRLVDDGRMRAGSRLGPAQHCVEWQRPPSLSSSSAVSQVSMTPSQLQYSPFDAPHFRVLCPPFPRPLVGFSLAREREREKRGVRSAWGCCRGPASNTPRPSPHRRGHLASLLAELASQLCLMPTSKLAGSGSHRAQPRCTSAHAEHSNLTRQP
ncbi:hypothetical protein LZ30DRAFT_430657 [Colletotrichum cereale]|nr:hypothetical protein LZ30DRAFT_430657 [Colletotrichum cereale]